MLLYFFKMRAEKYKRATDAAREGLLPGLLEGGGSLVTGIASGVTGLFSKPIEVCLPVCVCVYLYVCMHVCMSQCTQDRTTHYHRVQYNMT